MADAHDRSPHEPGDPRPAARHPVGRPRCATTATNGSTTGTGCASGTTPRCASTSRPRTPSPRPRSRTWRRSGDRLFEEIRGRVRETDASAPVRKGPHEYFTPDPGRARSTRCTAAGRGHAGSARPRRRAGTPRRRAGAARRERASPATPATSRSARSRRRPTSASLAYSTDYTGGERYTLRFRDVDDRHRPPRRGPRHVLRPRPGPTTARPSSTRGPTTRCGRGRSGATASAPPSPTTCSCSRRTTSASTWPSSARAAAATSWSRRRRSSRPRCWFVDADAPDGAAHGGRRRAATASSTTSSTTGRRRRRPLLRAHQRRRRELPAHGHARRRRPGASTGPRSSPTATTPGSTTSTRSRDHLVLSERADALEQLRVLDLADRRPSTWSRCPTRCTRSGSARNLEFDTDVVRLEYTSLVAPPSSFDYDLVDAAPSTSCASSRSPGTTATTLETHRAWATATDGTRVPISIVHRRGLARDGSAPMLLYGYGSYEISIDPTFSVSSAQPARPRRRVRDRARARRRRARPPLVRGRQAPDKRNTFTDFVAVRGAPGRPQGYTSPDRLAARGGSAGGLLMGAVANLAPTSSAPSSPRCRSSTASPRCSTRRCRSPSRSGRSGATRSTDPDVYAYMQALLAVRQRRRDRTTPRCSSTGGLQRPARCSTGSRRSGWRACGRRRPTTSSSCSRPRWARATRVRRAATTRGATRRSCSRSCSTRSAHRHASASTTRAADGARVAHDHECRRHRARGRAAPRRHAPSAPRACSATRTRSTAARCAPS